ncbi:MAG: ATP-binding protein [Bacteroidia bacterium]
MEQETGEVISADFHELVLKRVRLLSRQRIAWLRKIWSEVADGGTEPFNAHVEVDGYLSERDIPSLEKEWMAGSQLLKEISNQLNEIEEIISRDEASRLSMLIKTFGLNQVEVDILHASLSVSIDPNLARVYAYLQDNSARGYVTESLVAKLFSHGNFLLLDANSPLKIWGITKEIVPSPGEPARIECDPFMRSWLLGGNGIDEALNSFTNVQPVKKQLQDWPVKKVVSFIQRIISDEEQNSIRIFVSGPEGSGRKTFAAIVCQQLGLSLMSLNVDRIPESNWPQIYMRAHRQAFLSNAAIAWYGSAIHDKYWPQYIQPFNIQFVIGEADSFIQPADGIIDLRIELPVISVDERLTLWQQFVPSSAGWPKSGMEEMILRHQATIGQIVSIGQKRIPNIAEAYEALRSDAKHRLGNLAQPMNSDFTWDDLVVAEYLKKALEDFTFEATERIHFWEQPTAKRLFPQGKGLIALFTGSPGTGKTMAAQVIAASLRLDLFRIDLSSVVSKYIGESSKNIERILSRAKSMNVVLLFDEADSLFGKRTEIKDAHDRYANTDTNYLLQAIEEYPGIIILASNKKSNIDTGFMRRLRYLVDFSKPDSRQRLQLWRRILSELAGDKIAAEVDKDLLRLADLVEITGAQVKLTVLSALFIARREKVNIGLPHLLRGLERELIKEGRGLGRQVQQSLNN